MEETKAVVFDREARFTLKLRAPEGEKKVSLRFPTDEEWAERTRRRKVYIKQLGRGISETQVGAGEDVDAALFAKIRETDDNNDFDQYEASRLIQQLAEIEVDDVQPEPGGFRVVTRLPWGNTAHLINTPTQKDVFTFRRAFARVLDLPYGKQELTINLQAATTLYGKLVESTEGYAGTVPNIHQAAVVKAVADALDAAAQGDREANF